MRAEDDEAIAGSRSVEGPSAVAVLAVADGLRRRDPQLSAALAEHAARLSHDDERRGEAELSAVLARRELDRPDDVARRGVPALRTAELARRDRDAATLRCALADAALAWTDTTVAEALITPLGSGSALPEHVRLALTLVRADLAASSGDVAATDDLAAEAETLSATGEEQHLARVDVARARARARVVRGDRSGARDILGAAAETPVPDAVDGGRRRLLVIGDLVEVLVALDDPAAARAAATPALEGGVDAAATVLPLARVRCLTASRVHLPAREAGAADALARAVVDDLTGRGHDRRVAAAEEILADAAEARGDLAAALAARRRAHDRERTALLTEATARVALASAVAAPTGPGASGRPSERDHRPGPLTDGVLPGTTDGSRSASHTRASGTAPDAPATRRRRARADTGDRPSGPDPVRGGGPTVVADGRSGAHDRIADGGAGDGSPHGLSRILEEITADARATPSGSGTGDAGDAASSSLAPSGGETRADRRPASARRGGSDHQVDRPVTRRDRAGRSDPPAARAGAETPDEYAEDLRLTLVDLLAEYSDDPGGAPGARPTSSAPSAPSMPPAGRREPDPARAPRTPPTAWSFHDGASVADTPRTQAGEPQRPVDRPSTDVAAVPRQGDRVTVPDATGVRDTAEVDSGARLADLLADAMDAFRRSAPGNGTIGPVPPGHRERRGEYRGARR